MKFLYTFLLFSLSLAIHAQDTYHQNLDQWLMSNYNTPPAEWLIANTEADVYASVGSYNCTVSTESISGQDFSSVSRIQVNQAGDNPWDSGWRTENILSVQNGQKVLLVLWLRSTGGGSGKVNVFVERASNFQKEVYLTANVLEEWTQFLIPFEATTGNYAAGQMVFGFHLALQAQTIEVGGYTAIYYGDNVELNNLPADLNNDQYDGFQADAPWRAPAAQRIEQLRKADFSIQTQTTSGVPVANIPVKVEMIQHDFAFGTAVTAERIAGNNNHNVFYENKITNLDGNGHGFNWVVFENDLKWDGWEEEWFVNHNELVNAVNWFSDQDIKIRGHNLVWPGFQYLPDDIAPNASNPSYVLDRIEGRLDEILNYPGLGANRIPEWDVLNEIVVNTDLEATFMNEPGNTTGREIYADIFKKAKEISPDTKMYLNDYVTMTLNNTGGGLYDILKDRIQELLDAGAPIEGIGFQGHIGGSPNGIPSVLGTLDDFYDSFGLTAKITEFDMPPIVSEDLGANYLGDFLTAVFSHPSVDGFLFWNFWDGATWQNPGANLFRENWTQTPAGDMFIDLVFNQWWTDTLAVTNAEGQYEGRFFKGLYQVTYTCDDQEITQLVSLSEDQELIIDCNNLSTSTINPIQQKPAFKLSPNPARNLVSIHRSHSKEAEIQLYDSLGIALLKQKISGEVFELPIDLPSGMYLMELREGTVKSYERLIIE
ncbi:MAG: endo-1,4-beta-xylanase [Bacteroidota bacterium]